MIINRDKNEIAGKWNGPILKILLALLFLVFIPSGRANFTDPTCEVISFRSGRWTFNGYIYKPEGNGPFPVVVWNHGHHEHLTKATAGEYLELARLFTREGFILFLPDRHTREISRSDYSFELQNLLEQDPKNPETKQRQSAEALEINVKDVAAAVEWLKEQSYVDSHRMAVCGWSYGATLSLLLAEKHSDLRAAVLFSPGLKQWENNIVLQSALRRATRNCPLPIFMIQAQDDPTLEPIQILGKEVEAKGLPNRVQTYPHVGADKLERTTLALNGSDTWGYDVLRFLQGVIRD